MTRLVIPATISKVEERFIAAHVKGFGAEATIERKSTGWWIVIEQLAIHVGPDKPDFAAGELVKLSIEKAR